MTKLKTELQEVQSRIESNAITVREDSDERTFNVSISSNTPVQRYYGTETLRHTKESIERQESIPLLWAHQRSGYSEPGANILGRASNFSLSSGKLRADIRFSDVDSNKELLQKVRDKTIQDLSIGYRILDYEEKKRDDGQVDVVATKWRLNEVSLVDIPADNTIGIYRSDETTQNTSTTTKTEIAQENKRIIKTNQDITMPEVKDKSVPDVNQAITAERSRIKEIGSICDKFEIDQEQRSNWIEAGTSVQEVKDKLFERMDNKKQNNDISVDLPQNREGRYSLAAAYRSLFGISDHETGLAREISQDCERKGGKRSADNSILVPWRALVEGTRATYQAGSDPAGGDLVATDLLASELIEALRPTTIALQLGVRMLPGLVGDVAIPKQTGEATGYWLSTETTEITQSESTFSQVSLTPRTVGALSKITRQMSLQSSISMDAFIRQDLTNALSQTIDKAVFYGSGTLGTPRGIKNVSGIGSVAIGTNGGPVDPDKIIDLTTSIYTNNVTGNISLVTNSKVLGALMKLRENGSTGGYLWVNNTDTGTVSTMPGSFRGFPVYRSNQIISTNTKGSGTGLSEIYAGVFSDIIIGTWGPSIELAIGTVGNEFASAVRTVRALTSLDMVVRYPQSFAVTSDIST